MILYFNSRMDYSILMCQFNPTISMANSTYPCNLQLHSHSLTLLDPGYRMLCYICSASLCEVGCGP